MDDLISRQAAISHVDDVPYIKEHPNVGLLWKAWIENLPSAQPTIEPRAKGHWVTAKGGGCYCSECEEYALDRTDGRYVSVSVMSNFCPNCGADMRGGTP